MNARFIQVAIIGLFAFTANGEAQVNDYEAQKNKLVTDVAAAIQKTGKKKVATVDFIDLHGNVSELGRFLSEEVSVGLVMAQGTSFKVVDRSHLNRIMAEHKLTMLGLLEPANAKKLGQFSGADAIVFGTYTDLTNDVVLFVKIISTDSALIEGAARITIVKSPDMRKLLSEEILTDEGDVADARVKKDDPKVRLTQEFERMRVTLQSLRATEEGQIIALIAITNTTDMDKLRDSRGGEIAVAINSETKDKRPAYGAGYFGPEGNGVPDYSKKNVVLSPVAELVDNKGNRYELVRATGIGFALRQDDWTRIAVSQEAKLSLVFKVAKAKKVGGSEFTLQVELLADNWGAHLPRINNVYLEGLRMQGAKNTGQ